MAIKGRDSRGRSAGIIFNPLWLALLLSLLAVTLVDLRARTNPAYLLLVLAPVILYALYASVEGRVMSRVTPPRKVLFPLPVVWLCAGVVTLITLSNLQMLLHFVALYGGWNRALGQLGATAFVNEIQQNSLSPIALFVQVNYLLPVFLVPLAGYSARWRWVLLGPALLVLLFASGLSGTRVLFLDALITVVMVLALGVRLRPRLLLIGGAALLALVGLFAVLQSVRSNGQDISDGMDVLGNYYRISLQQGANVVLADQTRQPLYWTLRSTFSVPLVSQLLGTVPVYESVFGHLPIKRRSDDFEYVKSLGADPRYNTLGIYGYSFLDAGLWGLFIVAFSYLILHLLYRAYLSGNLFGVLLFPPFYALFLDQLRTNSIYSVRMPFFVLCAMFLFVISRLLIRRTAWHPSFASIKRA